MANKLHCLEEQTNCYHRIFWLTPVPAEQPQHCKGRATGWCLEHCPGSLRHQIHTRHCIPTGFTLLFVLVVPGKVWKQSARKQRNGWVWAGWGMSCCCEKDFHCLQQAQVVSHHKWTALNGQSTCVPNRVTDSKMQSRFLDCISQSAQGQHSQGG